MLISVEFFNRHGKKLRQSDFIDKSYAMDAITKHLAEHHANVVKVGGRLCFTLHQAEKRIDSPA